MTEWNIPSEHSLRGDYSAKAADWSIAQNWSGYRPEDHALWRRLYARQAALLPRYAAPEFRQAIAGLDVSQEIPNLETVSVALRKATGWHLIAVPGLIPEEIFFNHLAERRFPVTNWLRKPEEFDYLVEPDIFHDFFGHVPLLFDPVFADYMQAYGFKGAEAQRLGTTPILARLYWYMVEFGLIATGEGLRAYGAGILSSGGETVFSVENESPHRIWFNCARVMRTQYRIDDYQQTYFVLRSFEDLFQATQRDFRPLYAEIGDGGLIAPDTLLPGDGILNRGTQQHKNRKAA
ncbi:MAG TPA: phenylalanine 4-monooxygenase [Dongiaceae bacterium]|jgi:phenylalanine-4-hydroxylase|nr:phenylalanine 4-monooxygenase [Dongiaceae bacterium]